MKIGDTVYLVDETSTIPLIFTGHVADKLRARGIFENSAESFYEVGELLTEEEKNKKNEQYCKEDNCIVGKLFFETVETQEPVYEKGDSSYYDEHSIVGRSSSEISYYETKTEYFLCQKCERCKNKVSLYATKTTIKHNDKSVWVSSIKNDESGLFYFIVTNEIKKERGLVSYNIKQIKIQTMEI